MSLATTEEPESSAEISKETKTPTERLVTETPNTSGQESFSVYQFSFSIISKVGARNYKYTEKSNSLFC